MHNILKNSLENFEKIISTSELEKCEQQRINFVTKSFSIERINKMKIDDYVLGKGECTFCRFIEYKLKSLGDIRGATAAKYGVYYGKRGADNSLKYRFNNNLNCNDYDSAFKSVKRKIIDLLEKGAKNNLKDICSIKFSPMVRGKILYLYYPDKYLPIYSEADVNYFLDQLQLNGRGLNLLQKQDKLIKWKNEDPVAQNWNLLKFQRYLYYVFPDVKKDVKRANRLADIMLQEKLEECKYEDNGTRFSTKDTSNEKKKLIKVNGTYVYPRDAKVAQNALLKSNYKCQFDPSHECFQSKRSAKPYTEAHHLVPLSRHAIFDVNLDREENIVSLCCNCHAKIHKGKDSEEIIKTLFRLKASDLEKAGINITEETLLKMYK